MKTVVSFFTAFTLVWAMLHATAGTSATYYLSADGVDTNPGTIELPWKTLGRATADSLHPGDQLLLRGGDVFPGTLTLLGKHSGSAEAPVQVGAYGTGRPVIDGGKGMGIYLKACQHLQISNLEVRGLGRKSGNTKTGVFLMNANSTDLADLEVYGFQKSGIEVHECEDVNLLRIHAHDNGFAGISASGAFKQQKNKRLYIGYCLAENNPGDPTNLKNHSGNGIVIGEADTVLIEYCTATNNGWDMPRKGNGPVGIWLWNTHAGVIQHCISYRNRTAPGAMDGGGFDFDGGVSNSVIQYCLSYENEGAGYGLFQFPGALPWKNNTVRFCISENDGAGSKASVLFWNGDPSDKTFTGAYVYHNVFRNDSGPVIGFIDAKQADVFFWNNIFVGSSDFFAGKNAGARFLGNLWHAPDSIRFSVQGFRSLEAWSEKTGQEQLDGRLAGRQGDPLFSDHSLHHPTDPADLPLLPGYRLRPDSPALHSALPLGEGWGMDIGPQDFFGNFLNPEATRFSMGIEYLPE